MEEQENEEQDLGQELVEEGKKQIEQTAKDAGRQIAKEAGKATAKLAKEAFIKVILPNLPYILIAATIIGGLTLLGGAIYTSKNEVTKIGKTVSDSVQSLIEIGENGPVAPSKEDVIKQIDEELANIGIHDKLSLGLGTDSQAEDYLYKFLKAALSTQLPYIETQSNSEEALQGIVRIKRRSQDASNIQDLTFITHEKLEELIEKNDTSAVNYFSLDETLQLCIAKYTKTTVTSPTGETTVTNIVSEVKIPYRTMISQYGIPFEFLITLQQISLNPEYVSAVADLAKEQGIIELTIFDSTEVITTEYTYEYDLNSKWIEEVIVEDNASEEGIEGDSEGSSDGGSGAEIIIQKPGVTITTRSKASVLDDNADASTDSDSESTPKVEYQTRTSTDSKTETTITVNEINSIVANVTKANVWVITQKAEYTQNLSTEYPIGEEGIITEIDDETEPATPSQVNQTVQWKTNQIETTMETLEKTEWKMSGESSIDIDANKFLGLWRNSTGSYVEGADYLAEPLGKLVKYKMPGSFTKESPIGNIVNAKLMLYQLLENYETTQNHAQLMRYLIHLYETGEELEIDLSIYKVNEFNGALYGSTTVKEFIHYFEGTPKQTQDGKYVVFDDGAGNLTVGWGVYINAHPARFAARGINISTLKVGSTIDKTIVDSIEDEIIEEYRSYVIDITQGLGLEEYQIDALTSRAFNCGKSGGMSGFVQAYNQYGNTEQLYANLLNKPVTSKGQYMPGLEKRRKAEWDLFNRGYYINTGSYYSPVSANSSLIVQKAKECHDYLRINGYRYAQAGVNIPISPNVKTIDCSSFVSWVLYEAGFSQFAGYQKTSSYFAKNPMNWEKIAKENLQAGDILVYTGHVQIYAGDGKYYNCGGDKSIQNEAPSVYATSINDSTFLFGLRATK